MEVRPAPRGKIDGVFPGALSVHVITAWNPGGRPAAPDENDAAHQRLERRLEELGVEAREATGMAPDGAWAEAAFAVTGLERRTAITLGRDFGQLAVFEWANASNGLRVVRCDTGRASTAGWIAEALPMRFCPMADLATRSRSRCIRPGGPWGSRAMEAAAEWTVRRAVMLRALGCDVCGGGAPKTQAPGEPIVIVPVQDPAPADQSVWATRPARQPADTKQTKDE